MSALRTPGGPLALAGKTWAVLRITVASSFSYGGEILVRSLFLVIVLFIFTALWKATGRSQDVTGMTGFGLAQLIWYLAFTEAIVLSVPAQFDPPVDKEVRTGDVAYRLARPLPYPLYHLGAELGDRTLRFTLNLVIGCGVAWVMTGPIPLSPIAIGASCCAALAGFLADWIWSFTLSLASFWMEDTRGLHLLYRRVMQLLGGMLIPLEAYPEWLGAIVRALPFQYMFYRPARLFVQSDATGFGETMIALAVAAVAGLPLLWGVYRLGLRRVSAQGG
jgi:ABC-2 type transport system permease protein